MPEPAPSEKCGRRKKESRGGGPCNLSAGWGTPHPGTGPCRFHGGNTAGAIATAQKTAAVETARRFGVPRAIDPADGLLEEIAMSAGIRDWLAREVAAIDPDALIRGVEYIREKHTPDGTSTTKQVGAQLSLWWQAWNEERDRFARLCVATLRAGVAERQTRMAEQQGQLLVTVIRSILSDLQLTPEQQALVPDVVPRHLRLVSGAE